MKDIDLKIKEILRRKDITVKKMIDGVGLTEQGYIYSINKETLRVKTLIRISDYLKISPCVFFKDSNYQQNETVSSVYDNTENFTLLITDLRKENDFLKQTLKDKEEIIKLMKNQKA
jgi:TfoX/Sxy family transcriptional regulator of competence genes